MTPQTSERKTVDIRIRIVAGPRYRIASAVAFMLMVFLACYAKHVEHDSTQAAIYFVGATIIGLLIIRTEEDI